MDLGEININTRNWVDLAQDRDYWRALCECGIVPPGFILVIESGVLFKGSPALSNFHFDTYV